MLNGSFTVSPSWTTWRRLSGEADCLRVLASAVLRRSHWLSITAIAQSCRIYWHDSTLSVSDSPAVSVWPLLRISNHCLYIIHCSVGGLNRCHDCQHVVKREDWVKQALVLCSRLPTSHLCSAVRTYRLSAMCIVLHINVSILPNKKLCR